MRCLLDANVFIFLDVDPDRLSAAARREILNPANELHLSIASLWEMQLKIARGKLTLSRPLAEVVAAQCQANGLRIFGIEPAHVYRLGNLPFHHNDPFDRMIIAQALVEGMTIITSDGEFGPYGVAVLW
jgi:PIN domain nuclease of toxin-antitoxin system